jgi:uncharacterized membrane protein
VNLSRRFTACLAALWVSVLTLVVTPAALAADGVGLAGRVNDKFITFFCFGLIAFFAILVTVLSLIQGRLDAKKDQRRHDFDRFS